MVRSLSGIAPRLAPTSEPGAIRRKDRGLNHSGRPMVYRSDGGITSARKGPRT